MKRLFAFLLFITLFFTSCSLLDYTELSGDSSKTELSHNDKGKLLVVNTSSKTYHLSSCYIADKISQENRFETRDEEFLLKRGYAPCKICDASK